MELLLVKLGPLQCINEITGSLQPTALYSPGARYYTSMSSSVGRSAITGLRDLRGLDAVHADT